MIGGRSLNHALKISCPKCGGQMLDNLDRYVLIKGHDDELSFEVYVCARCSYTEFYSNQLGGNGPETIEVEEES